MSELKPIGIQRKRTKGWKMPENTIYVGRPTKWGNPFKPGGYLNAWGKAFIAIELGEMKPDRVREIYASGVFDNPTSLDNSLKWYELWIKFQIKNKNLDLSDIEGFNLACFCPLDKPCHRNVLLKLANK